MRLMINEINLAKFSGDTKCLSLVTVLNVILLNLTC